MIDNKNNTRTPGIRGEPLVRELNIRIRAVEEIINTLDNKVEQLSVARDSQSRQHLRQVLDERDKLRIELEFYKDLSEAIQTEPKKLSKEELEEE